MKSLECVARLLIESETAVEPRDCKFLSWPSVVNYCNFFFSGGHFAYETKQVTKTYQHIYTSKLSMPEQRSVILFCPLHFLQQARKHDLQGLLFSFPSSPACSPTLPLSSQHWLSMKYLPHRNPLLFPLNMHTCNNPFKINNKHKTVQDLV